MTEDSGAFKTNPGDCTGFGHFVNVRSAVRRRFHLRVERSPQKPSRMRGQFVKSARRGEIT